MLDDRAKEAIEPIVRGEQVLELVHGDDGEIARSARLARKRQQIADRCARFVSSQGSAWAAGCELDGQAAGADRDAEAVEAAFDPPLGIGGQLAQQVDEALGHIADRADAVEVHEAGVVSGVAHALEVSAQQRRLAEPPRRSEPDRDAIAGGALQHVELGAAIHEVVTGEGTLVVEWVTAAGHPALVRTLRTDVNAICVAT